MLTLENISVNYGAIEALRGVSMRVEKGEVVTLIGANGAGKTTTLRTITGLLAPSQGRITFEEESIGGMPAASSEARGGSTLRCAWIIAGTSSRRNGGAPMRSS